MRRVRSAVSAAWWRALTAAGLSPERWRSLSPVVRRAVVAFTWAGVALALVGFLGVWK
ncbi:MAG: hypothetical protein QOK22_1420, partial [Gaiellaceae bacterium]|nr:hypothetical protein [Gaiellaceae bacterium]